MSRILIKNIKGIFQVHDDTPRYKAGKKMADSNMLENAFLAIEDDRIVAFGKMKDWGGITDWRDLEVIDAEGKFILPTFCDSHTHAVFAATRESEFEDRIKGLSYEEIALKGGGIVNSARKLAGMSEDDLYNDAKNRVENLIDLGTGAIEIKSGYGLTVEAEVKMLRVVQRLKESLDIPVKSTFLGAHAFPKEYKENKKAYVKLIIDEMLPVIGKEKLADYMDCFCERNYFDVAQMEMLLEAGLKYDLIPKVHVNQFSVMGGVKAAIKYNALSVDHLEEMDNADVEALKGSDCMPTLLPGCSFFLSIPYGKARKLIENNLPVAIASDYNPGSSPSGNMQFLLSLACVKMNMTPTEALNAVTLNTAYAMGLGKEYGHISLGAKANFMITKPMDSLARIPYSFGENNIESVYINGKKRS